MPIGNDEIVFGFTVDPKDGYSADGNGCSVVNEDYDDGPFSGLTDPATIGDFVWDDLNRDGLPDTGEPGINGVTLDLYKDDNGNGQIDPGESVVATVTTSNNGTNDGAYDFTNLSAGDYIVVVTDTGNVLSQFDSTTNNSPLSVPDLVAGGDYNIADFGYASGVDLQVVKESSAVTVDPGQSLTYTLTVTNSSAGTATDVVVTDTLPIPAVTYSSATVTTGSGTCAFSAPDVTCTIGSIAGNGGTAVVTVEVTVN